MDEIRDGSSPKKSSETKTTLLEAPIRRTGGGNGDKSPFLETTNVEGSSSVSRTSSGKSIDQENLGPHPPLAPQKLPADTVHKPIVDAPATESTPAPSPHETYLQDTYLATMKIHVLTLSVLYYTNQGNATESNKRLNMLHGVMDAFCVSNPPSSQADSPSKPTRQWGPGDGTLLVPLSSATSLFSNPDPLPANRSLPRSRQYLTMQTTHPLTLFSLTFLVSAVSKRDAVGRKPRRGVFASEGERVCVGLREDMGKGKEREDVGVECEFLFVFSCSQGVGLMIILYADSRWAGYGQVVEVDERLACVEAELMSEVAGVRPVISLLAVNIESPDTYIPLFAACDPPLRLLGR